MGFGLAVARAGVFRIAAAVAAVFPFILSFPAPVCAADNADNTAVIRIAAVGDVMTGSIHPKAFLPPDDGAAIFDNVVPFFAGADLLIGNLEGPMADNGTAAKCNPKKPSKLCFEFLMPARYAKRLAKAGFSAMNIANNHLLDFGREGAAATAENLLRAGIQPVGGRHVARFTLKGKRVSVIGFSYSPPSQWSHSILDLAESARIVSEEKDETDLLIVAFHGGAEGEAAQHLPDADEKFAGTARGNPAAFARAVIDAGADLVLGHGPHVLRALSVYKGKLVAHSLGNFLTYGRFNLKGPSGVSCVLSVDLDAETGDFISGRVDPVKLVDGGIPVPDAAGKAVRLLRELTVADIPDPGLSIGDDGAITPDGVDSEGDTPAIIAPDGANEGK